jgi:hypothetical protein
MKIHPRALQASVLASLALLGALLSVGCGHDDPDADTTDVGVASDAVDLAAIPANQAEIVQDGSIPARATGVLIIPFLDGAHNPRFVASAQHGNLPLRGSCGVTFVSPHYAITSSHCVDNNNAWDPANQTFTVKQIDVAQANKNEFYFDSVMEGTFPNYTPLFVGGPSDQAQGYYSTSYSCKIASRCAWPAGGVTNYNCDNISANDVAMLRCSSRPQSGKWLPIANDAATVGGAVAVYWFHELFFTNNNPDMIAHYTNYSQLSNWHYLGAPTNVFLPFKSVPWPSAQRTRVGAGADADVRTDLYGCHGTSGSGVLSVSGGVYKLLGPAHSGGSAWVSSKLCDDPTGLTQGAPNNHGLTYSSNTSVNALVNPKYTTILANDRVPPAVCGDGTCNGSETVSTCPDDCGDCPAGRFDCCGDGICRTPAQCQKLCL